MTGTCTLCGNTIRIIFAENRCGACGNWQGE